MKESVMMYLLTETKGKRIKTDFKTKSMKIGNRWLIKDGVPVKERELGVVDSSLENYISELEEFYEKVYRVSVPNRTTNTRKQLFLAKDDEELTLRERVNGVDRSTARAIIEGELLCRIIDGSFYWDEEILGGKNFWKSKRIPSLVLGREELGL